MTLAKDVTAPLSQSLAAPRPVENTRDESRRMIQFTEDELRWMLKFHGDFVRQLTFLEVALKEKDRREGRKRR